MADHAQIIPFRCNLPPPKPARRTAQVVPIPSMSYRPLGRDLDAVAMAVRLHAMLEAGDRAGAAKAWRAHVAQIEARDKGMASPAQIAWMVEAYRSAVRREIDALKAK